MTTTTTSLYAAFASNPNSDRVILNRARAQEESAMFWGQPWHTLEEAAADMGAITLGRVHGGILCDVSDRLYLLTMGADGPRAAEVATQSDLEAVA